MRRKSLQILLAFTTIICENLPAKQTGVKKQCKPIACPAVEDPICVKIKYKQNANRTLFIRMLNKCEMQYTKCHTDIEAIKVPLKYCDHHNEFEKRKNNSKIIVQSEQSRRLKRSLVDPFLQVQFREDDEFEKEEDNEIGKETLREYGEDPTDNEQKHEDPEKIDNDQYQEDPDDKDDEQDKDHPDEQDDEQAHDDPDEEDEEQDNGDPNNRDGDQDHDDPDEEDDEQDHGDPDENDDEQDRKEPDNKDGEQDHGDRGENYDEQDREDPDDKDDEPKHDDPDCQDQDSDDEGDDNEGHDNNNDQEYNDRDPPSSVDAYDRAHAHVLTSFEKQMAEWNHEEYLPINGVKTRLVKGQDGEEYCPKSCPTRAVMVCARCKHHVYRTFMSKCHMRVFACNHTDEGLELADRFPCLMLAPYLMSDVKTTGVETQADDADTVQTYIYCRQKANRRDQNGQKIPIDPDDPMCSAKLLKLVEAHSDNTRDGLRTQ